MRRFVNDPSSVVGELLEGFAAAHSAIVRRVGERVIAAAALPPHGVRVIAGGGSGHEPALLGYVGAGMLDAVVVGDIFASPPAAAVLEAIREVDAGDGVLLVIGNYAGDVLNFEVAAEGARREGYRVELQLVTDDVGAGSPDEGSRRGLGGSVLIWKVAGAAAARGWSTSEVRRIAGVANTRARTYAVALRGCTFLGSAHPSFEIPDDSIAFGVGHGEPGLRMAPVRPIDGVVDEILGELTRAGPPLGGDEPVVTLVNGLGATSLLELYLVHRELARQLRELRVPIHRSFVGPFYTALDTAGFSITIMPVEAELAGLMDAPAVTSHFVQLSEEHE